MLTDILYCDDVADRSCTLGEPSVTVRKDNSRSVWTYYRCDGTPRNRSTCRNTVRADFIEPWVDGWLNKAPLIDDEIKENVYVPAKGHADEIQEIDDEIDGLPKDAPDYIAEVTRLYAEREQLIGARHRTGSHAKRVLPESIFVITGQPWTRQVSATISAELTLRCTSPLTRRSGLKASLTRSSEHS